MIVKRKPDQILIKVSSKIDSFGMQRVMDYIEYPQTTSKSNATQEDADRLADELNADWWKKNRYKFVS